MTSRFIEANISGEIVNKRGPEQTVMNSLIDETGATERTHAVEALQRSADHLRLVIDTVPGFVWSARPDGSIEFLNQRGLDYTGFSLEQIRGWNWKDTNILHPDDAQGLTATWSAIVASGQPGEIQARMRRFDGEYRWFLFRVAPLRDELGGLIAWWGIDLDIDERKRAETLLAGENRLLKMVASGCSLAEILSALCRLIEELSRGSLCGVLLVDHANCRVEHGAGPSLPPAYNEAIHGRLVTPSAGPCGLAICAKEQVIAANIASDTRWNEDWRNLALSHALHACWSTPIFSSNGAVLGTFAIYWREPRSPTAQDLKLIEQTTDLAAIAIERKRTEEALRASEHLARGQFAALTHTLDALAQESEPDKLLKHVLLTIVEQTKAHSVAAWNRNEDGARFDLIAVIENGRFQTREEAVHPAGKVSMLPQHHPVWREVLRTGEHGVVEDIGQESARMCVGSGDWHRVVEDIDPDPALTILVNHLRETGVRSVLFVPLLIAGEVAGTLAVRFQEKRTFRREEIELTRALAHQAMLALQLMRQSQQSRHAAVIAERNRIARDIHDTLAQGFTGVIMQLEAATGATTHGDIAEATNRIERASELARSSLGEARRSVRALRPQTLRNGKLFVALDGLLKRMAEGTNLNAEFHAEGDERSIPADFEEGLLRVTQEALTNAVKHANARNFSVTLSVDANKIQLRVVDDGRGFDPQHEHEGFGLIGMKERVDRMGGEFTVRAKPGVGTEILVELKDQSALKAEAGSEQS